MYAYACGDILFSVQSVFLHELYSGVARYITDIPCGWFNVLVGREVYVRSWVIKKSRKFMKTSAKWTFANMVLATLTLVFIASCAVPHSEVYSPDESPDVHLMLGTQIHVPLDVLNMGDANLKWRLANNEVNSVQYGLMTITSVGERHLGFDFALVDAIGEQMNISNQSIYRPNQAQVIEINGESIFVYAVIKSIMQNPDMSNSARISTQSNPSMNNNTRLTVIGSTNGVIADWGTSGTDWGAPEWERGVGGTPGGITDWGNQGIDWGVPEWERGTVRQPSGVADWGEMESYLL